MQPPPRGLKGCTVPADATTALLLAVGWEALCCTVLYCLCCTAQPSSPPVVPDLGALRQQQVQAKEQAADRVTMPSTSTVSSSAFLGVGHVINCASSIAPWTMFICPCPRCCSRFNSDSFCTSVLDSASSSSDDSDCDVLASESTPFLCSALHLWLLRR
eukprot:CAMPEP_0202863224 /NCGR_PEP_ID=MMETSP1391-20130828/3948_1 /ASSEMBLY_ACC=CAM_ASM_000867 /TAXON_ID=1034604 /ORGANISM="Chlamydomonas leiostraca, Strain SAG 11-49" /LENGTH=158 /DNA_ID=CAMNT_0049542835 /DNA_START=317 /DNA_END=794 /DNA_ORIENTATION=-